MGDKKSLPVRVTKTGKGKTKMEGPKVNWPKVVEKSKGK